MTVYKKKIVVRLRRASRIFAEAIEQPQAIPLPDMAKPAQNTASCSLSCKVAEAIPEKWKIASNILFRISGARRSPLADQRKHLGTRASRVEVHEQPSPEELLCKWPERAKRIGDKRTLLASHLGGQRAAFSVISLFTNRYSSTLLPSDNVLVRVM